MRLAELDDGYLVRLQRGEELIAGLAALMRDEEIGSGAVTGLGAVQGARLGFYDISERGYRERVFPATYELCGLTGTLSWYDGEPFPHVHVLLVDGDFRAFGGHCFEAEVSATLELRVWTSPDRVERRMDEAIGLHLMDLPRDCPIR